MPVKERPILFSGEMVRAILDGRKTVTRRPVKLRSRWVIEQREDGGLWPYDPTWAHGDDGSPWIACPYGQPGDRLWVKETWCTLEVGNVRVERLHDITEAEARAEGVERSVDGRWLEPGPDGPTLSTAREAFSHLWKRINGPGSWDANPWVWRVEFRRLT